MVGDRATASIPYAIDGGDSGARTVMARPGARATPATLKRFLVGPVQCEITGIAETPDGKALFVNVQHPGEEPPAGGVSDTTRFASHWPDGGGAARPRSATVVITKDDGGRVGT